MGSRGAEAQRPRQWSLDDRACQSRTSPYGASLHRSVISLTSLVRSTLGDLNERRRRERGRELELARKVWVGNTCAIHHGRRKGEDEVGRR